MQYGLIQTAVATPEIVVADCNHNSTAVIAILQQADQLGIKLTVFPELTITGYTCGDLFLQTTLLDGALIGLKDIITATAHMDTVAIVGAPLRWQGKLYNCGVVIAKGQILGVVPKQYLCNYGEVAEYRYFTAAPEHTAQIQLCGQQVPFGTDLLFTCQQMPEFCFAIEICADLWAPQPPSVSHATHGALLIANLAASNEGIGKTTQRQRLILAHSARLLCGYLYANAGAGESTTDLVFAGHNLIAENGELLAESALFSTGLTCSEIDVQRLATERRRQNIFAPTTQRSYTQILFSIPCSVTTLTRPIAQLPFVPANPQECKQQCELILSLQAEGLKKRLVHSHAQTIIIGISGGLDSTLALLAAVRTMDILQRSRTDIIAITMPCFGTTARTKNNAALLCQLLGVTLRTIAIGQSVLQHFADIGHDAADHSVTYENSQARERTQILMDVANQCNGLVVGTGDLSELALGWATYNGDHMSMYGVNASIPKTLIRHVVHYAAEQASDPQLENVLLDILATPVSPELLPAEENNDIAQKTEDLVGPYELHDFFLYYALRWACPPKKIYHLAQHAFANVYEKEIILHWLKTFYRRFFSQQFKRSCLPDGPKVGSISLSPRGDWHMPSDASAALWLKEINSL